jgi:hypothetical protein
MNRRIYSTAFDGQNWNEWTEVAGNGTTMLPVCTAIFNDRLFVFRVSTDSKIFCNVSDGQNWAGWRELGGTTAYPVTAAAIGNRLLVFSIGAGYNTFLNFTEDGQNWDGWRLVPGQPPTDLPVAATTSGGRLFLCTAWPIMEYTRLLGYPRVYPFGDYALGNNPQRFYRMLANISLDGANWSGAEEISGMGRTRLPLGVTDFGGQPFVFAVGTDQRAYFAARRDG